MSAASVSVTVTVTDCARCGGDHPALSFRPLTNPPADVSHFAECPELAEPILLLSVATPDETQRPLFEDPP